MLQDLIILLVAGTSSLETRTRRKKDNNASPSRTRQGQYFNAEQPPRLLKLKHQIGQLIPFQSGRTESAKKIPPHHNSAKLLTSPALSKPVLPPAPGVFFWGGLEGRSFSIPVAWVLLLWLFIVGGILLKQKQTVEVDELNHPKCVKDKFVIHQSWQIPSERSEKNDQASRRAIDGQKGRSLCTQDRNLDVCPTQVLSVHGPRTRHSPVKACA